jgi:hypothetical protein
MARTVRHEINKLQDEVRAMRVANGVGYRVRRTGQGQVLEISPGPRVRLLKAVRSVAFG